MASVISVKRLTINQVMRAVIQHTGREVVIKKFGFHIKLALRLMFIALIMRQERFAGISPLETGLSIDMEIVVRGSRQRLRAVEFPIEERPRLAGTTHFKAFRTSKLLLARLLQELRRKA